METLLIRLDLSHLEEASTKMMRIQYMVAFILPLWKLPRLPPGNSYRTSGELLGTKISYGNEGKGHEQSSTALASFHIYLPHHGIYPKLTVSYRNVHPNSLIMKEASQRLQRWGC